MSRSTVLAALNRRMSKHSGGIKGADRNNSNELVVRNSSQGINDLKYEIANDLGIDLGPETSARANGTVGGLMVKSMIKFAEQNIDQVEPIETDVDW